MGLTKPVVVSKPEDRRKTFQNSGFTLIELLVVIAIISILASILFPVFARARENARRTSCMSNLKQIGLGMVMYVQDYDGHFPHYSWDDGVQKPDAAHGGSWYPNSTHETLWFWQNMIYPYVKNVQVFICPSSPRADTNYGVPNGIYGPYAYHYGANRDVINNGSYFDPLMLASVNSPSSTYAIMDSHGYSIPYAYADHAPTTTNAYLPGVCTIFPPSSPSDYPSDCEEGRHFDGNNVAFADGHVKWLKTKTMVAQALKSNHGDWLPTN